MLINGVPERARAPEVRAGVAQSGVAAERRGIKQSTSAKAARHYRVPITPILGELFKNVAAPHGGRRKQTLEACSPHAHQIDARRTRRGTWTNAQNCSWGHCGSDFWAPDAQTDQTWPTFDQIWPESVQLGPISTNVVRIPARCGVKSGRTLVDGGAVAAQNSLQK